MNFRLNIILFYYFIQYYINNILLLNASNDYITYLNNTNNNRLLQDITTDTNTNNRMSICYSPFHLNTYENNFTKDTLKESIQNDLKLIQPYVDSIRTYYSSYKDVLITEIVKNMNLKIYLGISMSGGNELYEKQLKDAIQSAKEYPNTIKAIFIGNENVEPYGTISPDKLIIEIERIRLAIKGTNIPIGTVQRITEWLNDSNIEGIKKLANTCDIIGVNIYPMFDNNYNSKEPMLLMDILYDKMKLLYPKKEIIVAETGYSTCGTSPTGTNNILSISESFNYYHALNDWKKAKKIWFMAFDLPASATNRQELEQCFGLFDINGKPKFNKYSLIPSDTPITTSNLTTTPESVATSAPITTPKTTPALKTTPILTTTSQPVANPTATPTTTPTATPTTTPTATSPPITTLEPPTTTKPVPIRTTKPKQTNAPVETPSQSNISIKPAPANTQMSSTTPEPSQVTITPAPVNIEKNLSSVLNNNNGDNTYKQNNKNAIENTESFNQDINEPNIQSDITPFPYDNKISMKHQTC